MWGHFSPARCAAICTCLKALVAVFTEVSLVVVLAVVSNGVDHGRITHFLLGACSLAGALSSASGTRRLPQNAYDRCVPHGITSR